MSVGGAEEPLDAVLERVRKTAVVHPAVSAERRFQFGQRGVLPGDDLPGTDDVRRRGGGQHQGMLDRQLVRRAGRLIAEVAGDRLTGGPLGDQPTVEAGTSRQVVGGQRTGADQRLVQPEPVADDGHGRRRRGGEVGHHPTGEGLDQRRIRPDDGRRAVLGGGVGWVGTSCWPFDHRPAVRKSGVCHATTVGIPSGPLHRSDAPFRHWSDRSTARPSPSEGAPAALSYRGRRRG